MCKDANRCICFGVFVFGACFILVSPNKLSTAGCSFVYCSLSQQFRSTSGQEEAHVQRLILPDIEQNAARTAAFFFFFFQPHLLEM